MPVMRISWCSRHHPEAHGILEGTGQMYQLNWTGLKTISVELKSTILPPICGCVYTCLSDLSSFWKNKQTKWPLGISIAESPIAPPPLPHPRIPWCTLMRVPANGGFHKALSYFSCSFQHLCPSSNFQQHCLNHEKFCVNSRNYVHYCLVTTQISILFASSTLHYPSSGRNGLFYHYE